MSAALPCPPADIAGVVWWHARDGTESPEAPLVLAYILWLLALYNGIDNANHITRGQEQWILVTCVHDEYLQHV